jgi:putative SOS response-associated peptidase YedK
MINARSETLEEKASFKTPLRRKRCIVPVSGFYEWQAREGGKFPIYIYPKAQPIFALAGLWDSWRDPVSGDELRTFTIITTAANGFMRQYHERMPVILRREDYDLWLSPAEKTPDQLRPLLRPFDEDALTAHEVSRAVNTPTVDNPTLIERAS